MRYSVTILVTALLLTSLIILSTGFSEGQNVEDLTRKDISYGLPQETESLTTVEVFDTNNNGRDEIYLGASNFDDNSNGDDYVKSEGIFAYEYSPESGRWMPFGSGLPGEGSGIAFAAIGLGDVNGDGKMDIAAPVPTRWYLELEDPQPGVFIYTGDGFGNFQEHHVISLTNPIGPSYHDSSNEVEIVDLDGDGHNDIVVSTYIGIRVFYGDSTGTTWEEQSPQHPTQTEISGIAIGDLNNDDRLDLIGTPYQRSSDVVLYIQESDRVFRTRNFQETTAGFGVKIADLNDDGNNDVVFGTASDGIEVWLGEGRTTLTDFPCTQASNGLPDSDGNWNQVELGDVNGDNKLDIISACNERSTVNVFINDLPNGWIEVFTESNSLEVGGKPYGANFGDWDGDGQLDVAGCSWNHGANAWTVSLEGYGVPIANAGEDETINLGDSIRLDGRNSQDRDGDIVEWSWDCTTHPSVTLENFDTSRPTFTPAEEGEFIFELTVKDDEDQWSNPDTVQITVLDPAVNYPPVAVITAESQLGIVGKPVQLDGGDSYDQDGTVVGYEWDCKGKDVTFVGGDGSTPNFTPTEDGTHSISLVVIDDEGARSAPAYITIHVDYDAVDVKLGPFKYDNGDPLKGVDVWLQKDGHKHQAETDSDGYAEFVGGLPPGEYTCWVTEDGFTIIDEFGVTISYTGKISIEGGSIPTATSERTIFWIIAGITIVVIILVAVAIFIITISARKKAPQQMEAVVAQSAGSCPSCGGQLVFMQDFGSYHCSSCGQYFQSS